MKTRSQGLQFGNRKHKLVKLAHILTQINVEREREGYASSASTSTWMVRTSGGILELILDHPTMEPLDLLRCRDVCRSWRSTVANRHQSKAHSLLLPAVLYVPDNTKIARGTDDDAAGQVYRLNLSNDNVYRLNLSIYNNAFVDSNGKRFVCGATSSRGWLLLEDVHVQVRHVRKPS